MLAQGQVRCGACLSVFDARLHAVTDPVAATAPVAHDTVAATEPDTRAESATKDAAASAPTSSATATATAETDTRPDTAWQSSPVSSEPSQPSSIPFCAEPVSMASRSNEGNPLATAGWLLLSLLAALGLTAQLLWFERAQMAQYTALHSVYALLCEQVDCTLVEAVPTLIDNQGLHLQPHSKFSDALHVTILLENRAAFSQPWPGLKLRFTDLKGRLVAQRTFQPDEYLDTDGIDPQRMPSGQPMQIELEMASPGRRSVSYELQLVHARQAPAK